MGFISGFIQASAVLAAQAQQIAGRRRNRQQAVLDQAISDSKKRVREVDGVELSPEATPVPRGGSEQSRQEHQRQPPGGRPRSIGKIDVTI